MARVIDDRADWDDVASWSPNGYCILCAACVARAPGRRRRELTGGSATDVRTLGVGRL
ncbi:hypothetical protein [Blastococcus montanus]|uniref:hypothetical protein n=1 Tax=Blastococcus montanus TaxID=3144973 RepID=UPI0032092FE4